MKKVWKRVVSVILIAVMVQLQGIYAFAEEGGNDQMPDEVTRESVQEEQKEESDQNGICVEEWYVNPLFGDEIRESDLSDSKVTTPVTTYDEEQYLDSTEEAGAQIRQGMKEREESIVVYFQAPEYSKELLIEIAAQALVHTGNPVEGDYLRWQYAGWKTSTSYSEKDGMCYMTITYTYTYYTSNEQEMVVSEKLNEIFAEMAVAEKSDYGKVCAVYDYICEHTAYDYENLEDEEYKLKYTAYAALIDEKAVCQGYALLFYRMMLELGVDSRLIAGTGNGGAHGWNIVEIGGNYYNVDATWDAGDEEYQYFLKCENNFKDHVRDEEYSTDEFNTEYPMAPEDYDAENVVEELAAPAITSVYSRVQNSAKTTWTRVDGADGYELFRAADPEAAEEEWARVKTIKNGDTVQYTNVNLEIGQTYYYKVRAYTLNEDGTQNYSDFSNIGYMPAAVVFDNLYSNAVNRIRLLWNEVKGAHGYQIWRMNEDGSYSIVKTLGDKGNILTDDQGATVAYSNTGVEPGEIYTYRMRAFAILDGKKVFGTYSDEFEVAVMPEAPELVVSDIKENRATLTWNHVNGAAGYQIWRSENGSEEYKLVKSIVDGNETTYINRGLNSGGMYSYKIRAYAQCNGRKTFSAFSNIEKIQLK